GKNIHDRFLEPAGMIENIMRNSQLFGHRAGVANILTGTAATRAAHSLAMVIKLQGNADCLGTRPRSKRGNNARIDAAGHRHNDALARHVVTELEIRIDSVCHNYEVP